MIEPLLPHGPARRLPPRALAGAVSYDRIAGYFSSSMLEVAGEAIEAMADGDCPVRIICNSDLEPGRRPHRPRRPAGDDPGVEAVPAGRHLADTCGSAWNGSTGCSRQRRLQVKVLPDERFGLLHGKAGVDPPARTGRAVSLHRQRQRDRRAPGQLNYEIVWTDDSPEGVAWVRREFDALWRIPTPFPLADARGPGHRTRRPAHRRQRMPAPGGEADDAEPRSDRAADLPAGERAVGAPEVVRPPRLRAAQGGRRPARPGRSGRPGKDDPARARRQADAALGRGATSWPWCRSRCCASGRTSSGTCSSCHPRSGPARAGRTSTASSTPAPATRQRPAALPAPVRHRLDRPGAPSAEVRDALSALRWECVILDEAHHARRSNLGPTQAERGGRSEQPARRFWALAPQTKSMLLATATPVQLDPIEA